MTLKQIITNKCVAVYALPDFRQDAVNLVEGFVFVLEHLEVPEPRGFNSPKYWWKVLTEHQTGFIVSYDFEKCVDV